MHSYIRTSLTSLAVIGVMLAGLNGGVAAQTVDDAFRFSQRSPATGPRMMGYAGAGVAGVADYGAVYRNPAGLGYVQRSFFSGAMQYVRVEDNAFSSTGGFETNRQGYKTNSSRIGSFGYAYKAPTRRGSLVLALGFNQIHSFERTLQFSGTNSHSTISTSFLPFDGEYSLEGMELTSLADLPFMGFNGGLVEFFPEVLEGDPDAYPFLEAVAPGSPIGQYGRVTESGRMSEMSLGGAMEVAEDVMVGVGVNIVYGRYDFDSTFEEEDKFNVNGPADYSVLQDNGSLLEGFHSLVYNQSLTSDLLGVNARLGVSGELGHGLRLGAVVETPTIHTVEESYGTFLETVFDDGGRLSYGGRDDDIGNGFYDYDLVTPWRLGAGASFEAGRFTVLADAEWVDWSQMRFDAASDRAFFDGLNRSIRNDYRAVLNIRVGGEVRFGGVAVRIGRATQPEPYRGTVSSSSGSELNLDRAYYTGGVGIRISRSLHLDVGWITGEYNTVYLAYPEDSLGPRQDGLLHIDEQVRDSQVVLGVRYRF